MVFIISIVYPNVKNDPGDNYLLKVKELYFRDINSDSLINNSATARSLPLISQLGYGNVRTGDNYNTSEDTVVIGNGWVLQVLDFSDSNNTVNLGEKKLNGAIYDIVVNEYEAFVATTNGVYLVDLSQPSNIEIIGSWEALGESDSFSKIYKINSGIYVCGFNTLYLLDVEDYNNIYLIDSVPLSGDICTDIVKYQNYLYISTLDGLVIDIVDLSNTNSIDLIDHHPSIGSIVTSMKVYNTLLYVVSYNKVFVFSLENPIVITILQENNFEPYVLGNIGGDSLAIFISLVNIGEGYNPGILLIDNSDSINLSIETYIEFLWDESPIFDIWGVLKKGHTLNVFAGYGIWRLDIHNVNNIFSKTFFATFGYNPTPLDYDDEKIYAVTRFSGLWVIDVSTPEFPNLLCNTLTLPNIIYDVDVNSDYIFLTSDSLLLIAEQDMQENIVIFDTLIFNWEITQSKIFEDKLFALSPENGIIVVDISNPNESQIITYYDAPNVIDYTFDSIDDIIYLADNVHSQLKMVSINDINNPIELPVIIPFPNIQIVRFNQNKLYLLNNQKLAIYQNDDPNNIYPELLSELLVNCSPKLQIEYPFVYCGDMYVIKSSDSTNLIIVDSVQISYDWIVNEQYIYSSDYGFSIYYNDLLNLNLTQFGKYDYGLPVITTYPNPFNENINILVNTKTEENIFMYIYDLTGRVIRFETLKVNSNGTHSFNWNGENKFGNTVSSGFYICSIIVSSSLDKKKYFKQILFLK